MPTYYRDDPKYLDRVITNDEEIKLRDTPESSGFLTKAANLRTHYSLEERCLSSI